MAAEDVDPARIAIVVGQILTPSAHLPGVSRAQEFVGHRGSRFGLGGDSAPDRTDLLPNTRYVVVVPDQPKLKLCPFDVQPTPPRPPPLHVAPA